MKKIITLALALSLGAALAACGDRAPKPLDNTKPLVYAQEQGGDSRVPVINLDSQAVEEINEEITRYTRAGATRYDFFVARHGDILSLMLCGVAGDGTRMYHTWLLDAQAGERTDSQGLLDIAGWDAEELRGNFHAKLEHFYQGQRDENGNLPAHAQRFYEKMLAELGHPDAPRLFLHEDGRLFWVSQLSFGDGLYIEEDTHYWAQDYHEILMDPALPDDAYAFDMTIMEHIGWAMLES